MVNYLNVSFDRVEYTMVFLMRCRVDLMLSLNLEVLSSSVILIFVFLFVLVLPLDFQALY